MEKAEAEMGLGPASFPIPKPGCYTKSKKGCGFTGLSSGGPRSVRCECARKSKIFLVVERSDRGKGRRSSPTSQKML